MPKSKSNRRRARNSNNTDAAIISSLHSSARGDIVSCADDTRRSAPSWVLTQKPPKNFNSKIVWLKETYVKFLTLSAGGGVVELNIATALTDLPNVASIISLYDQYCIYSIFARAIVDSTTQASTTVNLGRIISALDYDSTTALSTEANILKYGTAQASDLVPGKSYERYCKPVVATVLGSSNSTANTGTSQNRSWLNSNFSSVPHFGIRFLTLGNTTAATASIAIYVTAIVGMRNNY